MLVRNFVKKSLDNQKKLFIILISVCAASGLLALVLNGESNVYRAEHYIELNPEKRQTLTSIPRVCLWKSRYGTAMT